MKKIILLNLFAIIFLFAFAQKEKLPVIKSPVFKKDTISIKKYGAIEDGNTGFNKGLIELQFYSIIRCESGFSGVFIYANDAGNATGQSYVPIN